MGREQITVTLKDSMGTDLSTVNSARVSFDKEGMFTIVKEYGNGYVEMGLEDKDKNLINYLATHNHSTPFRHNQVQILCEAPIFLAAQLKKHQAGLSWNEVSRRYVDTPPEFFVPDEWRGRPDGSIKQGSGGEVLNRELIEAYYHSGVIKNSLNIYNKLLENNVAPEMARMVLPQSMMTSWYWSGNLLAFAHIYKERIADGAQLEAQWFAEELDKVIRPLFPVSWSALVGEANAMH